jgi:2-dehydropantoate 2-reductase
MTSRIAIVGAGAIGGYLGVKLALAGAEVGFIARNRNLAAIRERGFKLVHPDGREEHASNVRAAASGSELGVQDYVLLTVKAHQVADVLPAIEGLLGPDTTVVSMLNGVPWWYFHALPGAWSERRLESVDPGGLIAAAIAPERVIGSVVYPAAELVEPGVVKLVEGNRFTLGEPSNERTPRIEALSTLMMQAGFKAPVARDIRGEIWVKLWGNLSFNPISALTHTTLEDICTYGPTRDLATTMMTEAKAVAEKLGVVFKITLEQRIAGAAAVGAHKTSMLQDVEAGRATERAALLGAVIELAEIVEEPVPTLRAVNALLQGLEQQVAKAGRGFRLGP